jgi:hypothetical protein
MASQRDVGVADTLPPDDVVESAPGSGAPAHWDRYEVFELLGKGGMGMVYRARDRRLDRTIAIKFIRGADPNLVLRFLREARAQARIDHPNICRVYEVGEVEGRPYIALQLVPGEPLHVAAARMSLEDKLAVMPLRPRARRGSADRHRGHRGRLSLSGPGSHGTHWRALVPGRGRGSAPAARPARQQRLRRLLAVPRREGVRPQSQVTLRRR